MASPLSVKKNNYFENPKRSDIYTPLWLSEYIHDIVKHSGIKTATILDPAIGAGSLTNPFRKKGSFIIGCDINPESEKCCDEFFNEKFEDIGDLDYFGRDNIKVPDLILCNPPFNSASGKKLYPEVFLRHMETLFGNDIPIIMIVPMGFLLNQRQKSKRWRYLRDNWNVTSIIALPLDTFPGVEFHCEIVCFNCHGFKPYYFIPEHYIPRPE